MAHGVGDRTAADDWLGGVRHVATGIEFWEEVVEVDHNPYLPSTNRKAVSDTRIGRDLERMRAKSLGVCALQAVFGDARATGKLVVDHDVHWSVGRLLDGSVNERCKRAAVGIRDDPRRRGVKDPRHLESLDLSQTAAVSIAVDRSIGMDTRRREALFRRGEVWEEVRAQIQNRAPGNRRARVKRGLKCLRAGCTGRHRVDESSRRCEGTRRDVVIDRQSLAAGATGAARGPSMVESRVDKCSGEARCVFGIGLWPGTDTVQSVAQRTRLEAKQVAGHAQSREQVRARAGTNRKRLRHSITIGTRSDHGRCASRVHPVARLGTALGATAFGAQGESPTTTRTSRARL